MKLTKSALAVAALLASTQAYSVENKVLLVGIDGVQYERLQALNTPAFDRLHVRKAYTGGIAGTASEQGTKSGPGWATILTGVWANKHKVDSNGSGLADSAFPSVYRRIKQQYPNADIHSYSTWSPIHSQFFSNDLSLLNGKNAGGSDTTNLNHALGALKNNNPDFVFLHLDEPDVVGHSKCFGNDYDSSIQLADSRLGQLLDEVERREAGGENWLVMVTTDHGRTPGSGCHHGNQTREEKTIFIASNKVLNAEHTQVVPNLPDSSFDNIYGNPSQAAITPTILKFMGINVTVSDKFDSIPLLGDLGVRKVQRNNNQFSWYSSDNGNVTIYRNGTQVDQVVAGLQSWQDSAPEVTGSVDYVFDLNNAPVGYRDSFVKINAVHGWSLSKSYFFRNDNKYVRYDTVLDKADSGYPSYVSNGNWPGLEPYRDDIVAAFKANGSTVYYFLDDGRYLSYDVGSDKVRSGYPKEINDSTWPGLGAYKSKIKSTLRWTGDRVYFFLDDGQYLRYDLGNDSVDSGYPKPVNNSTWPGLGAYATQLRAAMKWSDSRAYFFLDNNQYIRYSIASDSADSGYPKATNNSSWPGLMTP